MIRMTPISKPTNSVRLVGKVPADGEELLLCQRSGDCQKRDDKDEAPDQHRGRNGQVVEHRVRRQTGKGAAVVGGTLRIGVEDLAETVRSTIGDAGKALR